MQTSNILSAVELHEMRLSDAVSGNTILGRPSHYSERRGEFYQILVQNGFDGIVKVFSLGRPTLIKRILLKFKRGVKKLMLKGGER